jgi:hypothetical protein
MEHLDHQETPEHQVLLAHQETPEHQEHRVRVVMLEHQVQVVLDLQQ